LHAGAAARRAAHHRRRHPRDRGRVGGLFRAARGARGLRGAGGGEMTHLLSLRSVSKVFTLGSREVRAVENVSLDVEEGECLAIVGESGSGKSTVANMVLGIYPPSEGEILLRGEALPARRQLVHRRAIQLVQQNPMSSL